MQLVRAAALLSLACLAAMPAAGCSPTELGCPRGTRRVEGVCEPLSDAGMDGGTSAPDAPGADVPPSDDAAATPDGGGPVDPGLPTFPTTIDHLSFAVLTGAGVNDGTDANTLSLCLTATDCFPMNVRDVNDFRRGEMDVYHFEDVRLPRTAVDRVELRSTGGTDAWRPTCVEVRFDGEPVYCQDGLTQFFGNGAASETERWSDPLGLHEGCTTCYPETVTHGPMIGSVTDARARVWLRTDATRRVALHLVDESRPSEAPIVAYAYPRPGDDFTATLEVTGLASERSYRVFAEVDGMLSGAPGSFTTPPAPGTSASFRVAFGSCARSETQPIFGPIRATAPDLFLFVGDNHYANSDDLGSLWWFYRDALAIPERAALLSATPTLAVWDDHDYVGNNTDGSAPGRATALRAFGDYWANPSAGLPDAPGVFFHASWADVDFFMLDDRYERGAKGAAGAEIIGDAQAAWLETALRESTATFRVIASGSIFSQNGDETWLDYPASRSRLFDFVRDEGIPGVVLISGDIHRSHLRRIHRAAAGGYDLPEVVSSPLANSNSTCPASGEPDAEVVACLDANRYFAVLDVDTTLADPRIVARILDETGGEVASMTIRRSDLE